MGLSFQFSRDSSLNEKGVRHRLDEGVSTLSSCCGVEGGPQCGQNCGQRLQTCQGAHDGSIQAISARLHGRSLCTSAPGSPFQTPITNIAPQSTHHRQHRHVVRNRYPTRKIDTSIAQQTIAVSRLVRDQSHKCYNSCLKRPNQYQNR
jgi:hypothetical protein